MFAESCWKVNFGGEYEKMFINTSVPPFCFIIPSITSTDKVRHFLREKLVMYALTLFMNFQPSFTEN